jgi:hypothetical protein
MKFQRNKKKQCRPMEVELIQNVFSSVRKEKFFYEFYEKKNSRNFTIKQRFSCSQKHPGKVSIAQRMVEIKIFAKGLTTTIFRTERQQHLRLFAKIFKSMLSKDQKRTTMLVQP